MGEDKLDNSKGSEVNSENPATSFSCEKSEDYNAIITLLKGYQRAKTISDVSYPKNKALPRSSVRKKATKENKKLEPWEEDAKSKRRLRLIVFTALLIILTIQTCHMNNAINAVIEKAMSKYEISSGGGNISNIFISENILIHVIELLKWYIGATVIELVGAFVFIVKSVFEVPKNPEKEPQKTSDLKQHNGISE